MAEAMSTVEGFTRDALRRSASTLFSNGKRSIVAFHRLNPRTRTPAQVALNVVAASSTIRRSAGFKRQNPRHLSIVVFNPKLQRKSHGQAVRANRAGKARPQWPERDAG